MFKKIISLLLAVMMIMSLFTVMATSTGAVTYENTKLYFDVNGTGWTMGDKDKVGFYIYGDDFEPIAWGGKKTLGTSEGDGIFSFDPAAKKIELEEGVQYKVIFTKNMGEEQSADLYFDTSCFGHCAYCNGEMIENTVDSTKKSQVALWKDLDPAEYGPVKGITSLGNVVGTCLPQGKTDEDLFNTWLIETGAQSLKNAMKYTVQPGKKTSQQLVDDIGAALGLTKDFVKSAIEDNAQAIADALALDTTLTVTFDWKYDDSTLPSGAHTHTPGEAVQENVTPASCKAEGSYDEVVYCTECGEEISRETKTIDKLAHTPGEAVQENVVAASCSAAGSYDEVVYCTECKTEISRDKKTIDKLAHTPAEPVVDTMSYIPATCTEEGSQTLITVCSECGEELERKTETIKTVPHTLTEVPEVPATEEAEGVKAHFVCSVCEKLFSDAEGKVEVTAEELVIPKLAHVHTPGEAKEEDLVPATCKAAGSYNLVVRCTACGEIISSEPKTIEMLAHEIEFVEEVPAGLVIDGMKAHYECKNCGDLFADEEGTQPVTAEELVIKAAHVRGDADGDGVLDQVDATMIQRYLAEFPVPDTFDAIAADADIDGEIDIVDVTLIQRVLLKICNWDKIPANA